MNATRCLALALVTLGAPTVAYSQVNTPATTIDQARLVATVREATARYRDRTEAIDAGYRRIGPDFPGMGEHWISVPLLLEGGVDPRRPPILEYVEINGVPTLVGAAFAVLLAPGTEPSTTGLPVDAGVWHYHGGTVSEESFMRGHAHALPSRHDKPRIAVLHVWAWLDNPDGPFATDNWALPFARLGLARPSQPPSPEAAHALGLAAAGESYYLAVLTPERDRNAPRRADIASLLGTAAIDIREVLRTQPLDVAMAAAAARWRAARSDIRAIGGTWIGGDEATVP